MTYKEKIVDALKNLGGHAYLKDIYEVFENISSGESLPKSYKAIIRATLSITVQIQLFMMDKRICFIQLMELEMAIGD